MPPEPWPGHADALTYARQLFAPGTVIELRAFVPFGNDRVGIASGYFDDPEKLVRAAAVLDRNAESIHTTINPVNPVLLARAANRIIHGAKHTTGDDAIVRRLRLLIDIDPIRPSGISATDEEKAAALLVRDEILAYLRALGFPEPIIADSGNGGHLVYSIDLPIDDDGLVEAVLHALAFRFNTDKVKVDESVFNPSRISKLYGTYVRKGDSTADRPHRRSRIESEPQTLTVVPEPALRAVAVTAPAEPPRSAPHVHASQSKLDIDRLLSEHGIEVARSGPWRGGQRWVLSTCPFNLEHTDRSAFVVQFANGALAAGCHHNGCMGKAWKDFAPILGLKRGGFVGSVGSSPGAAEEFPDPLPLPSEMLPVAPFEFDYLPRRLQRWVRDICERMQCPPDFLFVAVVITLAAVLGRKLGIRPKRLDVWLVICNLWGGVIGRPGVLKTPALEEILRPLKQLEREADDEFLKELAAFQEASVLAKERRKARTKDLKDALEAGEDGSEIAKEIANNKPAAPRCRRYLVNDPTVEKIGEILNENPNGVLYYRDELIGFFQSLDKEGQQCARAFYLETWNGTGSYTYDRIGRGTVRIEAAILSILGSIQPGPLHRYLIGATQNGKADDGLLQRFQVLVWPDPSPEWVNHDRAPDRVAEAEAFEVYRTLHELDPDIGETTIQLGEKKPIPFLHFSEEAQPVFDAWRAKLEIYLRSGEEGEAFESLLAKYRKLVPALALLFHLADGHTGPVGLESLDRAIRASEYLKSHARRIYAVTRSPEMAAARVLAGHLLKRDLTDDFPAGAVLRKGWSGLGTFEEVDRAAKVLVDIGWLLPLREQNPSGGRPRERYRINPKIHTRGADGADETDETLAPETASAPQTNGRASGVADKTDETRTANRRHDEVRPPGGADETHESQTRGVSSVSSVERATPVRAEAPSSFERRVKDLFGASDAPEVHDA